MSRITESDLLNFATAMIDAFLELWFGFFRNTNERSSRSGNFGFHSFIQEVIPKMNPGIPDSHNRMDTLSLITGD